MKLPELKITVVVSQPFEQNTYVVWLSARKECVVIDPGLEPQKIIKQLQRHELTPVAILNTHGHGDHIGGNGVLKKHWPTCPVVIGQGDAPKLGDARENLSADFGIPLVSPPADVTVKDGETYSAAGIDWKVLEIPGHTAGHVVYLCEERRPAKVFVGDVIFAGSIGRTDFPDGDFPKLVQGIQEKLFRLSDETELYPGHGPPTTVGKEKRSNPFVRAVGRV